ncbi:MAG TPA: Cof-type HAD-IIB family hydrolase [Tepidisphaeraceae bacterium]|jgi:hypothetical protein|nr:Cof-type HAD-IIB family hydrolase [Tepidisphaeraceae bacterium]
MNERPHDDIRLIAIDLDGTLLSDSKTVAQQTIASVASAVEQGVKVVIASARPPRSVRAIYQQLKLDTWQINYNGAMIWDEPARSVVGHTPLDCDLVLRIISAARAMHPEVLMTCEITDRWHTDRDDQTYTTETGRLFPPDVVAPLESFCNQPISKLLLLAHPRQIAALFGMLTERFGDQIAMVSTDADLIQIVHPTASKGAALRTVADHYDIAMANVLAIGDAANDVPMLQAAGVAVAMDNASPAVKAVADWVAPSNNDHGVCAALRRYGVCNQA